MFRFLDVSEQQFCYRWNWRSQNTVWLKVHKWTTKSGKKKTCTWCCVCVAKPSDKTHDTNDNVITKTHSIFHTSQMNLNTWIDVGVIPFLHSPVVKFLSSWFAPHRGSRLKFKLSASVMSSMHAVSVTFRLWVLHSIQHPLLLTLFQSTAIPPALFPQPWGQQ